MTADGAAEEEFLFVYGTLLPGFAPARIAPVVCRLRYVGSGFVRGRLYDLGGYPGAILGKMAAMIVGQVFRLPNHSRILRWLDEYEEFDPDRARSSEFVRRKSLVVMRGGKRIDCWVYVYNRVPGRAPRILSGDFAKYRAS